MPQSTKKDGIGIVEKYGSWLRYTKAPTKSAPFLLTSSELRNTANCVKS